MGFASSLTLRFLRSKDLQSTPPTDGSQQQQQAASNHLTGAARRTASTSTSFTSTSFSSSSFSTATAFLQQKDADPIFAVCNASFLADEKRSAAIIAAYLEQLTNKRFAPMDAESLKRYNLENDPLDTPFQDWILHLIESTNSTVVLCAVICLRRALNPEEPDLLKTQPLRQLSLYNRHRVLFTCVMLTAKYLIDMPVPMKKWVRMGQNCWTPACICSMEKKVLDALSWKMHIDPWKFADFVHSLNCIATQEA
eukprot:TRINITY_DN8827_c0_g1::TRINITY_DN8827_c0_g1_i1::g.18987::m.18987 TRINITY_DN8827_c0_g1::TRINITY_DN8827_c0_g1_i1::g.18987  ORF type:complete len:253 (-),score=30.06,Cyclin_N/PF00134.18/2.1e+03,Cyclin_N/PF00134.18/5.2e-09,Cyclin/PF08613.6/0.00027 TRINITY_DN8827_c0_g1_i1:13-771(-)